MPAGRGRRTVLTVAIALTALFAGAGSAQAATIDVTTVEDEFNNVPSSTGCALREAVEAAHTDMPHGGCPAGSVMTQDNIRLQPGSTYKLEIPGIFESENQTGDLNPRDHMNIIVVGLGEAGMATIDAQNLDRAIGLKNTMDGTEFRVAIDDVRFVNGFTDGSGGALSGSDNAVDVTSAIFEDNAAVGTGGAIDSTGDLEISHSTFTDNSAKPSDPTSHGGAISYDIRDTLPFGSMDITSSSFVGNQAGGDGGAVYAFPGNDPHFANDTFTRNTGSNGGAIAIGPDPSEQPSIHNVTVVGNTAEAIAGGGGLYVGTGLKVQGFGSIYAGNTSPMGGVNCDIDGEFFGYLGSHNLDGGNSCELPVTPGVGNLINTDPQLSPLALYAVEGGFFSQPLPMLAPFDGSPAVDAIPAADCQVSTDQRNVNRQGAPCTIGAFEGSVPRPAVPVATTPAAIAPAITPATPRKKCKKGRKLKRGKCVKKKKKK